MIMTVCAYALCWTIADRPQGMPPYECPSLQRAFLEAFDAKGDPARVTCELREARK